MLSRHIEPLLNEALEDTPVVVINGARQTGKSTLAQMVARSQGRSYLTLDDRAVLAAARSDPTGFVAALGPKVVIDEIQRAPDLLVDIKASVDRERCPGRFLLTGSADVLLLPQVADSLAGRMEVLTLWPLSDAELQGDVPFNRVDALFDSPAQDLQAPPCERPALVESLVRGGFPDALVRSRPNRRAAWFDAYIDSVMQRDVRELAQIDQLAQVPHLLQLLAARSASLLNLAELSRSLALPQTTLRRYFTLLQTLFLVHLVPAWARNPGKRLVKAPKLALCDTGLLCALQGLDARTLVEANGLPGALVETWVATQLLRHLAFSRRGLSLWHYRSQSGIEVDFLLEDRQGGLVGIEVKAAASVDERDFKGLKHLRDTEPGTFRRGIVLYGGREKVAFADNLVALPLSWWWGRQA